MKKKVSSFFGISFEKSGSSAIDWQYCLHTLAVSLFLEVEHHDKNVARSLHATFLMASCDKST